jgi:hypothetical protein
LWVWGKNTLGQLGNDSSVNISQPIQVMIDKTWNVISFGGDFSGGLAVPMASPTPTSTPTPTTTPSPT